MIGDIVISIYNSCKLIFFMKKRVLKQILKNKVVKYAELRAL